MELSPCCGARLLAAFGPWLVLLAAAIGPRRAWAAVQVRIAPAAAVPFTPAQLGEAIALRLDQQRQDTPVVVSIDDLGIPGSYRLGVGQRRCQVDLHGQTGAHAVRTVALLAVDLVESDPLPVADWRRWGAGIEALGSPTGGWGDGRIEGQLELDRRLSPRWSLTGGAGYGRTTRTVLGQTLSVNSIPVRVGLGWDRGWIAARGGPALRVRWAGGARGTIFGGWLEGRLRLVHGAAGKLALVLAAELATWRQEIRPRGGSTVFSTGLVTPWLGLSLSSP